MIKNKFTVEQNWNDNRSNLVRQIKKHHFPRISKIKIRDFNIGLNVVIADARI